MFTSTQLVNFCKDMLGMPYWYGTCVYKCSSSLLASKTRQYPTHYTANRKSGYQKGINNKQVCTDCVGLIKGFFWTSGGIGVKNYINNNGDFTNKYCSNGCPDKSANGMLEWCKKNGAKWGKINTLPEVPGILLFCAGHVGVYIGDGYAIEARGFKYGVVKTKVKNRSWTTWAYLPNTLLNYDTQESIIATIYDYTFARTLRKTSPYMRGEDVVELQTRLNEFGYSCGVADGILGAKTEKAIKKFQKDHKLTVDGQFGPKSANMLIQILNT